MSDSFFVAPNSHVNGATDRLSAGDQTDAFARELQARFGPDAVQNVYKPTTSHSAQSTLPSRPTPTPRLSLPPLLKALPILPAEVSKSASGPTFPAGSTLASTPSASSNPPTADSSFTHTTPDELASILGDPKALVIDIRPHAQYANARLPNALSLSVPSTLLKRPLFSLERLAEMLPPGAQSRLQGWPQASRVLVYDADAAQVSPGGNLHGLLRKFSAAGCQSHVLSWLKGGFQAVWRSHRELIDADPPSDDEEDADNSGGDEPTTALRTNHLPLAAFTQTSTTSHMTAAATPYSRTAGNHATHTAANPFFDAIRQNTELSQGITERIPLRLNPDVRLRAQQDLPFPWLREIARRSDVGTSSADAEEGAEALAMQFYRIELAEQRRLTGVMQHHSQHSGAASVSEPGTRPENGSQGADASFPYSITAGIEKGDKNRYRNIWPFEHARVRIQHRPSSQSDDYVNASFVQPLGTNKRYIATQGPLPATYTDFWTLCWQQNVHIIVMLTREVEGAMVKCGHYWSDGAYGPLRLRLLSSTGTADTDDSIKRLEPGENSYFALPDPKQDVSKDGPSLVRRSFELTHTGYPDASPRVITQFQYLAWPDMNVPDDPHGLLDLVDEVDALAQHEDSGPDALAEKARARDDARWKGNDPSESEPSTGIIRHALENRPVLLHCSAGVGRSGGFIIVDAVLDGIKRELFGKSHTSTSVDLMAIDDADESDEGKETDTQDAVMDIDARAFFNVNPSVADSIMAGPPSEKVRRIMSRNQRGNTADHSSATPGGPTRRVRRSSGSSPWGKNDPLRAPLRKWLASTTEARASAGSSSSSPAPPGPLRRNSAMEVVSPGPVQPIQTSLLTPSSAVGTSFPSSGEMTRQTMSHNHSASAPPRMNSMLNPIAAEGKDDHHRALSVPAHSSQNGGGQRRERQRSSGASSKLRKTPPSVFDSVASSIAMTSSLAPSVFSSEIGDSDTSLTTPPTVNELSSNEHVHLKHTPSPPALNHAAPTILPDTSLKTPRVNSSSNGRGLGMKISLPDASAPAVDAFDYTRPRTLHANTSPTALSAFEEPVRQVVEDMREQRMSLCQSLRQYVFVHQAIVEGALRLVDARRKAETMEGVSDPAHADEKAAPNVPSGEMSLSPNTAKRRRSPTESSPAEASMYTDGAALAKRPSIKRVASASRSAAQAK